MYVWLTVFIIITSLEGLIWHEKDPDSMDTMTRYWQVFLVWPCAIAVIRLVIYLVWFRKETPQFFLEKYGPEKSYEQVRDSIRLIYKEEDVEMVHQYLVKQHRAKAKQPKPTLISLFSKHYYKQTIAGCVFQTIQQFSGINFFIFYAVIIFNSIGTNGDIANLILSISNTCGGILGAFMVNLVGRKTNFVVGIILQAISFWMFSMMKYYEWYTLLYFPCILYMVSFAVGLGGCSYPWTAETLPPIGVGLT